MLFLMACACMLSWSYESIDLRQSHFLHERPVRNGLMTLSLMCTTALVAGCYCGWSDTTNLERIHMFVIHTALVFDGLLLIVLFLPEMHPDTSLAIWEAWTPPRTTCLLQQNLKVNVRMRRKTLSVKQR